MDATKNLLMLILAVSWISEKAALPCPYQVSGANLTEDGEFVLQVCQCERAVLDCLGLFEIPKLYTGPKIEVVKNAFFEEGFITTIPNNSLPAKLRNLAFEYNPITNISEDAFTNSADTLIGLSFTAAAFTRLPVAIEKLKNLSTLVINRTPVVDWNNVTLKSISKTVRYLTLRRDGFVTWPSWLKLFTLLKSLDLSNNDLKSLPEDAFASMENTLTELTLANVNLTQMPAVLSRLHKLKSLDVSNNPFVNADDELNLLTTFPFAANVTTLLFKSVGLTELPDYSNLTNLIEIDMTSNSITNIIADHFPENIKSIYMGANKVTAITDTSFKNMLNLKELILSANPISTITPSAFESLTGLTLLYLYNVSLKEFPQQLTSLVSLEILVISGPHLQCACPHNPEVVQWFASYNGTLQGYCANDRNIDEYLGGPCQLKTTTKASTIQTTKKSGNEAPALCCNVLCTYVCMSVLFLMRVFIY